MKRFIISNFQLYTSPRVIVARFGKFFLLKIVIVKKVRWETQYKELKVNIFVIMKNDKYRTDALVEEIKHLPIC